MPCKKSLRLAGRGSSTAFFSGSQTGNLSPLEPVDHPPSTSARWAASGLGRSDCRRSTRTLTCEGVVFEVAVAVGINLLTQRLQLLVAEAQLSKHGTPHVGGSAHQPQVTQAMAVREDRLSGDVIGIGHEGQDA